MAEVVLRDGADVEAYLRDAIISVGEIGLIELKAIESERFRTVAVEPGNRRVSLIESGLLLGGDGRRLAALAAVSRVTASRLEGPRGTGPRSGRLRAGPLLR